MKVQFKFDNGTSQIILTPESAREKQISQITMNKEYAKVIRLIASADDSIVFEISDGEIRDVRPVGVSFPGIQISSHNLKEL